MFTPGELLPSGLDQCIVRPTALHFMYGYMVGSDVLAWCGALTAQLIRLACNLPTRPGLVRLGINAGTNASNNDNVLQGHV